MGRTYHPFIPDSDLAFEIGASAVEIQIGIATRPQVTGSDSGSGNDVVDRSDVFGKSPAVNTSEVDFATFLVPPCCSAALTSNCCMALLSADLCWLAFCNTAVLVVVWAREVNPENMNRIKNKVRSKDGTLLLFISVF
jgi:hypothetical protein